MVLARRNTHASRKGDGFAPPIVRKRRAKHDWRDSLIALFISGCAPCAGIGSGDGTDCGA
jgi:hypothetical protein